MNADTLKPREQDTEEHWISISDMMAGLMVIFLFIAISYMLHISADRARMKAIAVAYQQLQIDLYNDLMEEFEYDLPGWNAELNKETLSIWFRGPEVLFVQGGWKLSEYYKQILDNFFPRYIKVFTDTQTKNDKEELIPKYLNDIAEIRIEGHTSSEWSELVSKDEAYILNMQLSQSRTRSVLAHVLQMPEISTKKEWLKQFVTANGLSSSKLIIINGREDEEKSRRVEFRVRTKAEKRIVEILER